MWHISNFFIVRIAYNNSSTSLPVVTNKNEADLSKDEILDSITDATNNDRNTGALVGHYVDEIPCIQFEIENNTKYDLESVELAFRINGDYYYETLYDLNAYSIKTVDVKLDYTPEEGNNNISFAIAAYDLQYKN